MDVHTQFLVHQSLLAHRGVITVDNKPPLVVDQAQPLPQAQEEVVVHHYTDSVAELDGLVSFSALSVFILDMA